jgi:hypothetical protein
VLVKETKAEEHTNFAFVAWVANPSYPLLRLQR